MAFVWNGIEFRVADTQPEEAELIGWASRWLDVNDDRYVESEQFQEVIHSITLPRIWECEFWFSVDFGSAPTSAIDELLAILLRSKSKVSIGSFKYVGSPS